MTDLTEQWEKDEIYKGTYYCKSKLDGHQCIASFVSNRDLFDCDYKGTLNKGYWEVLAEVPSYEEWEKLNWYAGNGVEKNQELKMENTKLKERLKKTQELELEVRKENAKLIKDCKTLAQTLLKVSPEHREWLETNFKEYL